jgi:hypothetical protein
MLNMEQSVADTAFQVQYRKEAVMGFEQGVSYLRHSVLTEAEYKGNQATSWSPTRAAQPPTPAASTA